LNIGECMSKDVYDQLAEALDRLPNGFPRTESRVEVAILKKLFTREEALLAGLLGREYEPCDVIAGWVGFPEGEVRSRLVDMEERGLLWSDTHDGVRRFRLAPFIVGIYESQSMDHDFAHLVERYFAEGGAAGIMGPQPALHRVVPSRGAVKTELILPYEDVKAILQANKTFHLANCICREQQDQIGRKCDFPLRTCMSFTAYERPPREGDISRDEALAWLDKFEEMGLVHTVSNVMKGPSIAGTFSYVCNCCGCCCGILRGITDFGIENSVAHANYYSEIDAGECIGCGVCRDRCQVKAISLENGVAIVDRARCIGCGLCTTKCPSGAAKLVRKPNGEIVHPPADFAAWEQERIKNRGC